MCPRFHESRIRARRRPEHGEAVSLVEIMLALVIASLLLSAAISTYRTQMSETSLDTARMTLERTKQEIERWQIEHGRDYPYSHPPHETQDPWGTPIRVDPERHRISSAGPDRTFSEGADDMTLSFTRYLPPRKTPPRSPSWRSLPGGRIRVSWLPPSTSLPLQGYAIEYSTQTAPGWRLLATTDAKTVSVDIVPPGAGPLYLRIIPIYETDRRGPPSRMLTCYRASSSPPSLNLVPDEITVRRGSPFELRIEASSHGAPLSRLVLDGTHTCSLEGTYLATSVILWYDSPGRYEYSVEVEDANGASTDGTCVIEVQ